MSIHDSQKLRKLGIKESPQSYKGKTYEEPIININWQKTEYFPPNQEQNI
jgi:hypothetical protein